MHLPKLGCIMARFELQHSSTGLSLCFQCGSPGEAALSLRGNGAASLVLYCINSHRGVWEPLASRQMLHAHLTSLRLEASSGHGHCTTHKHNRAAYKN